MKNNMNTIRIYEYVKLYRYKKIRVKNYIIFLKQHETKNIYKYINYKFNYIFRSYKVSEKLEANRKEAESLEGAFFP